MLLRTAWCLMLLLLLVTLAAPQVKQRYDSMLQEMAAFRAERQQWEEGQAAAERRLADERQSFEATAKSQVGAFSLCVYA